MITLTKTELAWLWDIAGREAEICDRNAVQADNAAERALYELRAANLYNVAAKLLAAGDVNANVKRIAVQ